MNSLTKQAALSAVRGVAVVAVFAAGLTLTSLAGAQQWRFQPEIGLGLEYDDNARLQTDPALVQEIDGYLIDASLAIGYDTQRTSFELTPRLRSRVYDEIPDVDSDDQFLDFDFNHVTLKSEFGIRSSFNRESVRTAERADPDFDVDDPNEIPIDETGDTFSNERRERFHIAPQWSYKFTERTSLDLRASYTDVSYDESLVSFLVDYTDWRLEGALSRNLSERTRAYFGVGMRQFENELGVNDVDGVGARVGIQSDISETTLVQAEIGYEETERSLTGESDGNFVANFNIVRRLETVSLLAQYRRDVAAGGNGRVTARDSLNFTLQKQFTERVTGDLGLRAFQTESIDDQAVNFQELDYAEFRAALNVALSRAFSVEGDYRHARRERGNAGEADSNAFILWLIYRPTEIVR